MTNSISLKGLKNETRNIGGLFEDFSTIREMEKQALNNTIYESTRSKPLSTHRRKKSNLNKTAILNISQIEPTAPPSMSRSVSAKRLPP